VLLAVATLLQLGEAGYKSLELLYYYQAVFRLREGELTVDLRILAQIEHAYINSCYKFTLSYYNFVATEGTKTLSLERFTGSKYPQMCLRSGLSPGPR